MPGLLTTTTNYFVNNSYDHNNHITINYHSQQLQPYINKDSNFNHYYSFSHFLNNNLTNYPNHYIITVLTQLQVQPNHQPLSQTSLPHNCRPASLPVCRWL